MAWAQLYFLIFYSVTHDMANDYLFVLKSDSWDGQQLTLVLKSDPFHDQQLFFKLKSDPCHGQP